MPKHERAPQPPDAGRKDPSAPKGRPTPGRKQRNAEARARARRRRRIVRLWWAALAIVVVGSLAALIVTG